jgi:hypothetical protein
MEPSRRRRREPEERSHGKTSDARMPNQVVGILDISHSEINIVLPRPLFVTKLEVTYKQYIIHIMSVYSGHTNNNLEGGRQRFSVT